MTDLRRTSKKNGERVKLKNGRRHTEKKVRGSLLKQKARVVGLNRVERKSKQRGEKNHTK